MPNIDLFTTRFNWQLPVYVSQVPDTQTLDVDTLAIRGRDWMPMPIRLPYYPKSGTTVPRIPLLPPALRSKMAKLTVVPRSIETSRFQSATTTKLGPTSSSIAQTTPFEFAIVPAPGVVYLQVTMEEGVFHCIFPKHPAGPSHTYYDGLQHLLWCLH